jgi:hypothetical protein
MTDTEALAAPAQAELTPLDPAWIPEKLQKHVDPNSPPPARLMGAKAMVPMSPRDMVHVVYQCMLDPEPKIAIVARRTFAAFDDRILNSVLSDAIAPEVLGELAKSLIRSPPHLEKLLLNKATPDSAYVHVGRGSDDAAIIGMVAGNQERLLRCHDIVRALTENPKALRSELDRAIDFLVRQGVFLEGMEAFEDSFSRLGKAEMLEALKNVKVDVVALSAVEQKVCTQHGLTPEEVLEGSDAINELLEAAAHEEGVSGDLARTALNRLPIPIQLKLALTGKHARASEALQSSNKMVAMAGIRNPAINEADASRIARNKSMHEDVIRFICNNGDWTKSYAVKLSLVMNPKCSPRFVMSWMALLRQSDLKTLAKSKQVPSSVQAQAKRLLDQKNRR